MSSASRTSQLLTADDYRSLPEDGRQYQLIEGDLVMSPAPNRLHQDIVGNVFSILRGHAVSHGGAVYVAPFDVFLDENNVLQPDILFFSEERAAKALNDEGAQSAPDLVVEVLSPSTALRDKNLKRRVFSRSGVVEMWLIDPTLRQVQVYQFEISTEKPVSILEEFEILSSSLLPGSEIPCREIFHQRYT